MSNINYLQEDLRPLFLYFDVIRWLLIVFVLIQIVFFLLSWLSPMPLHLGTMQIHLDPGGMASGEVGKLSMPQKLSGFLIGLPALLTLTLGVLRLGKILVKFQEGKIFSEGTISHLRGSIGAILLAIILSTLERPVRWLAFNALNASGAYPLSFDITSSELLLILTCCLFYLIIGVMHEGQRLSEENKGFV